MCVLLQLVCVTLTARLVLQISELGNKQATTLPSMVSFDFQCCTGNKWRLSVNRNGVYSSSFDGELRPPALYRK